MPATPITDSPNISSLNSKIVADLCGGNFLVDVTPSVWIGTGYDDVQGASVMITNPVGVVIKEYPTSGFDIEPQMTGVVTVPIPLIAANYQYGTYVITVRLTDEDGDTYLVTKSVNLCPPDPNNATRKYGCLNMSIQGNCRTGKVIFLLNNPSNYKGTEFSSQVNALTVKYPTASGLANATTTLGSFSLALYEGEYQVSGTVCALYNYGDAVYFKVNYKVKCSKIIKCIIDECCVFAKLDELNLKIQSDCTQAEKDATASIIVNALWLKQLADLAGNCGADPSDYINQLEDILGCQCTCNCSEGTPIIGSDATNDWIYRALLTQVDEDAPTAVNSISNTIEVVYTRLGVGSYRGTITGLTSDLTEDSLFVLTSPEGENGVEVIFNDADSFNINTVDSSDVASDDILSNFSLQISLI